MDRMGFGGAPQEKEVKERERMEMKKGKRGIA